MRISKLYLAFFIAALFFAACDEYEDTEIPSPTYDDSPAVRFAASNSTVFELDPENDLSVSLTVIRDNGTDALEVPVDVVTNTDNSFVVPGSISFSAGEDTTFLTVEMSESAATGTALTIELEFGDDYVNPYKEEYGSYSGEVSIVKWNVLGEAQFYDSFSFYKVATVTLSQRDDMPEIYRINSPYQEGILLDAEWTGWIGGTTQDNIAFTLSGENVTWDSFWYMNLLYDGVAGQEIKAYMPSELDADGDELSVLVSDDDGEPLYFEMYPYFYIDGLGGWSPGSPVYLGFPGFDLAGALGLSVYEE